MEIRLIIIFLLCILCMGQSVKAENTQGQTTLQNISANNDENVQPTEDSMKNALINPQNIEFAKCCASFEMSTEKLFYLAISAINANNFEIEEIQSKMGYILFRAVNKSFLVSISKENDTHSMIKITPADNVYFFPYGVVYNIFYYIDLNKTESLEMF